MKKLIALLIVALSLFSCKNKESKEQTELKPAAKIEVDKTLMRVTFSIVAEQNDKACLFYTEDGTINFDDKKTVWVDIKGSKSPQDIVFTLPKNVLPDHLRVDLGRGKNPLQTYFDIKEFSVDYLDKKFEAKGIMVFNYFYPNKDLNIITPKSTLLTKKDINQETGVILYPYLPLTDELSKIIK